MGKKDASYKPPVCQMLGAPKEKAVADSKRKYNQILFFFQIVKSLSLPRLDLKISLRSYFSMQSGYHLVLCLSSFIPPTYSRRLVQGKLMGELPMPSL